MAITNQKLETSMILTLDAGLDKKGKPVTKKFTLRKIKPAAIDQDVYDVSTAISGLIKFPTNEISRQDLGSLISK